MRTRRIVISSLAAIAFSGSAFADQAISPAHSTTAASHPSQSRTTAQPGRTSGSGGKSAVTPYAGYSYGADSSHCISLTNCQERHTTFGVSFGAAGGTGVELDVAYAKDFFGVTAGTNSSVLTVMSNGVIAIPIGPVRPFVVGGIGLIRPHVESNPIDLITAKKALGYDFGGGVMISLGSRLGLRGDLRRFRTMTGEPLSFSRASAGLTLKF